MNGKKALTLFAIGLVILFVLGAFNLILVDKFAKTRGKIKIEHKWQQLYNMI